MGGIESKQNVGSWTVLQRLVPVRTLPVYITHFLENVNKDATMYEKSWYIPLSQYSAKWPELFCSTGVKTVLALDRAAQGITVKNSTIPFLDPSQVLLTLGHFRKAR